MQHMTGVERWSDTRVTSEGVTGPWREVRVFTAAGHDERGGDWEE